MKADLKHRRAFLTHPFQVDLVEAGLDEWLEQLRDDIAADRYIPSACGMVAAPKPHGAIRPGADLAIQDQVVYSALLQLVRGEVQPALEWADPPPDYAYRLLTDHTRRDWFQPYFPRWKAFDADSLELIRGGREIVVTADIAGYYELIDLSTLRSDLNALGVDREALRLLETSLHRWARVPRRGIPQGFSPSDILGKLYLNAVDRAMADEGFVHRRWVDDFRVFCEDEREARRALLRLTGLLGSRGLVVQSAKTRIRSAADARARFHQVHGVLEPIRNDFIARLVNAGALARPSVTAAEIDEALAQLGEDDPVEVLHEAFDTHFVVDPGNFNKTLLRFLLRRLGSAGDPYALDTVIPYLATHPEETEAVLRYAEAVGATERVEVHYVAMDQDARAPYPYQTFQLLRWRLAVSAAPTEHFLRWVRIKAFEPVSLWAVRSAARAILGRWGSPADLERLQAAYAGAASDLEHAELVCCLERMEVGRRNAFLGHVGGDGELTSRATRLVRQGAVRWDAS
ncbi:MAG: RNA-directed DNA polymerase [Gemmatimonadota bacterium]